MKAFSLLMSLIFLSSCATTMPGDDATTNTEDISAAISMNGEMSENRFRMYQVAIQNNTNKWIEIDSVTMEPGEPADILLGDKIGAWFEAKNLEKKVSDYNTSLVLGSIALAGAAVAVGSQHPQTSSLGLIAMGGAVAASSVQAFVEGKNKADFQRLFPVTHLFHPFLIPPKKVVQRWIMVEYAKNPINNTFYFDLKTKDKKVFEIGYIGEHNQSSGKNKNQDLDQDLRRNQN